MKLPKTAGAAGKTADAGENGNVAQASVVVTSVSRSPITTMPEGISMV